MAIKLGAADMDLAWEAAEVIMRQVAAGDVDPADATSEVIGLIDLAATDNPTLMTVIRKATDA